MSKRKSRQLVLVLGKEENPHNWLAEEFFKVVSASASSVLRLQPETQEELLLRARARQDLGNGSVALGWPLVVVLESDGLNNFSFTDKNSFAVLWAKTIPDLDDLCEAVLVKMHGLRKC